MNIVKFRVLRLRTAILAGITEVGGHTGFWPLRKPVHFQVGVNCDEIRVERGKLLVLAGARLVAEAKYGSKRDRAEAEKELDWENLLRPRDRHGR